MTEFGLADAVLRTAKLPMVKAAAKRTLAAVRVGAAATLSSRVSAFPHLTTVQSRDNLLLSPAARSLDFKVSRVGSKAMPH